VFTKATWCIRAALVTWVGISTRVIVCRTILTRDNVSATCYKRYAGHLVY